MDAEKGKGKYTGAAGIAPQMPFRNVCKRHPQDGGKMKSGLFLAKIGLSENNRKALIHALPIGNFYDPRYGDFEITPEFLGKLIEGTNRWWAAGASSRLKLKTHDPDLAEPAGAVISLKLESNGLWLEAELLPNAYFAIREGSYTRFSPEWYDDYADEQKRKYGPILYGGAIINDPLFATSLDGIFLIEEDGSILKVAARKWEPITQKKEQRKMDTEKLKELTGSDDPAEQEKMITKWKADAEAKPKAEEEKEPAEPAEGEEKKEASADESGKRIAALESDFAASNAELIKLRKEAAQKSRAELLEKGYREGKITFDQKTKWAEAEKCAAFPSNESLAAFLKTAAKVIPDPLGTEADLPAGETATDADKKSAAKLDMTVEDFQRLNKGEISRIKKGKKVKE